MVSLSPDPLPLTPLPGTLLPTLSGALGRLWRSQASTPTSADATTFAISRASAVLRAWRTASYGRGRGRSLRQSLLLRTPLRGPCGPCGSGDSLLCGGMGVGLGYYFFEHIFLGIFINLFDWFQNVADFLLIYNIGA